MLLMFPSFKFSKMLEWSTADIAGNDTRLYASRSRFFMREREKPQAMALLVTYYICIYIFLL